jgi:hypothetical protein
MTLVTIFALIGVSQTIFTCIGRYQTDSYEQVSRYILLICVIGFFFPVCYRGFFRQYRFRRLQVLILLLLRHNCDSISHKRHSVVFESLGWIGWLITRLRRSQCCSRCNVLPKCNQWKSCSAYKVN